MFIKKIDETNENKQLNNHIAITVDIHNIDSQNIKGIPNSAFGEKGESFKDFILSDQTDRNKKIAKCGKL